MEKTFETKFGEITLRDVMIDTDGTNLESGIEVKLDGEVIGELIDLEFDEDTTVEEVEEMVEANCDF